ncbi:hypothetical protein BGW80DRAFT_1330017 [Lactifluus volemus]|nr:hypothetical protein BGW80DRAFT_1330017 [Lactifluus volemus]
MSRHIFLCLGSVASFFQSGEPTKLVTKDMSNASVHATGVLKAVYLVKGFQYSIFLSSPHVALKITPNRQSCCAYLTYRW